MLDGKHTNCYYFSYQNRKRGPAGAARFFCFQNMPTAAYFTLGCKVNQYETEKIREELERLGFSTVNFGSLADVYIVNSCAVTGTADAKSRRAIRQAVRRSPSAFVVATGCYVELEPAAAAGIDGVDLVVGNQEKHLIPERILARFPNLRTLGRDRLQILPPRGSPSTASGTCRPRTRTRAIVKVQDGCNQFCAYCTVPYARGRQWSRSLPEVIDEMRALAGFGYKEVVLAGIRLGSYAGGLPRLVRAASEVEGIERIRLSSIEVWEIDDDLIRAMAESPKVCRHLHVPLQSGDGRVLGLMRRPYSPEQYAETIQKVRENIPGLGLTTDVMVGFPGESEEAFERSRRFVEEMQFSRLHVFRYSPRPRTEAAGLPDQVPEPEKTRRSRKMMELGIKLQRRFAQRLVGQTVPVLVESRRTELLAGFTDNYVEVQFAGSDRLRGRIVPIRLDCAAETGQAFGRVLHREEKEAEGIV